MVSILDVLRGVAIFYGMIWLTMNFYNNYPLLKLYLDTRFNNKTVYTRAEDQVPGGEYPTIDVFLPAYKESRVLRHSIKSVRRANYPQDKISLLVLTEPDDAQTEAVLDEIREELAFDEVDFSGGYFTELTVPAEYPGNGNKPRALNFAFQESYGDIVGVIDAEDIVDPNLFLKVVGAIDREGYDYAQGILDMRNEGDGWLNTLFRGEYGWWYQLVLPAIYNAGYPVPLGGTTNFYDRDVLSEISDIREERFGARWTPEEDLWLSNVPDTGPIPWDPVNVTEDFELGMLFWLENYDLALIDSITREESPINVRTWIQQRTRWQKGKIQTFIQYVRHPPENGTARSHIWLQSVVPHLGPINVSGIIFVALVANLLLEIEFAPVILGILLMGLVFISEHMILQGYGYWKASDAPRSLRIVRMLLNSSTLLAYWSLVWIADNRAIYQVYRNDQEWEKTEHHGRHLTTDS